MEQYNIIGALRDYATAKGWHFVYGFDDLYKNAEVQKEYANGEMVLLADFRAVPTYANAQASSIAYTSLLMLGRKFDPDGTPCSLDETSIQKYDRRLKFLAQTLSNMIGDFACSNEMEVTGASITVEPNVYDTNIDFAISNNAIFTQ